MCYNFLLSLGRSKKSFVNIVLLSTHLPQNYAVPGLYSNVAMEQPEKKSPKAVAENMVQSVEKEGIYAMKSPPEESMVVDWMETEVTDVVQETADVENPYPMFTTGQLERIREKGLDLDALTVGQQKAMAKMMEDYIPVATAYSLAGFEK